MIQNPRYFKKKLLVLKENDFEFLFFDEKNIHLHYGQLKTMAASKIDKVCKLIDPEEIISKIAPCFPTLLFDSQSFVRGWN